MSLKRRVDVEDERSGWKKRQKEQLFQKSNQEATEQESIAPIVVDYVAHYSSVNSQKSEDNHVISDSAGSNNYSSFAHSVMSKMGYQQGRGLGRDQQGISEPIEAQVQIDKKGLGYDRGALKTNFGASFDAEEIYWDKKVDWMAPYAGQIPDDGCLNDWMQIGDRKLQIEDEDLFCDRELLNTMLALKSHFDTLENSQLMRARSRANPYESLKSGIFQNRAALKMADMDYATGFIFSDPKYPNGKPMLSPDQPALLLFADICAGPGGFTEYITWRRGWRCKGWGLTLKDPDSGSDFKLDRFLAGSCESFEPYYGVGGAEGDGDILKTENIEAFRAYVLNHSKPEGGVHVVMADGGFSVEGNENIQEILSKHLIMCQVLCALGILAKHGNFLCKLFDCFTLFTSSLVYLTHLCFDSIGIYKPITSRPANSERYLVCRGYRGQDVCANIINHLKNMSENMHSLHKNSEELEQLDVLALVPFDQMSDAFRSYLTESNNEILKQQNAALRKVIQFIKNPTLVEERQTQIRDGYLDKWKVPNEGRKSRLRSDPLKKFQELCPGHNALVSGEVALKPDNLTKFIGSLHEYRFCFVGTDLAREVWLSDGGNWVYRSKSLTRWDRVEGNYQLELPKDTIVEVEKLQEHKFEGSSSSSSRSSKVVHITDVLMVGGLLVDNKPFKERLHFAQQLVRAVSKPSVAHGCRARVKELMRLEHLEEKLNGLQRRRTASVASSLSSRLELCVVLPDGYFYECHGIRVVRILKESYSMLISNSTGKFYFFDKRTASSQYECPAAANASFWDCKQNCARWLKEPGVQFSLDEDHKCADRLSRTDLLQHIHHLKSESRSSPSKLLK